MGGGSFVPVQGYWRFYANASPPSTPLANENTIANLTDGSIIRLRVSIDETGGASVSSALWVVQYREGTGGTWTDLGASNHWNWADGADTEGSVVSTLLSDANFAGQYIESATYGSSVQKSKVNEFDLSIQATGNESADTDYYFRVLTIDGTSVGAGASLPEVHTPAAAGGFQPAWANNANPQGVIR